MRALAVFAEEPYETGDLAELLTAPDEGVDVTFTQYRGPFAPGDIPEDARKFWEDTIREWTETDAYDKYIEENTLKPVYREGQEFEEYLEEYEKTVDPVFD